MRYEIAVCLRTSDIVWINRPHFPGLYNNLQIFRMDLINIMLDDHERVECDDNHLVECPCKTKCLKGISKRKERQALDQHQRNRDETVNERFDNWVFLHQKF